jgi:hypothetical protein
MSCIEEGVFYIRKADWNSEPMGVVLRAVSKAVAATCRKIKGQ